MRTQSERRVKALFKLFPGVDGWNSGGGAQTIRPFGNMLSKANLGNRAVVAHDSLL